MRLSMEEGDPGFGHPDIMRAKVFLDGAEEKYALTADDELGYIKRFVGRGGLFLLGPKDKPLTEEVYGQVRIEVPA